MAAVLALGTSLAYGLANYLGPRFARSAPVLTVLIVGQLCSLALAAAVVALSGSPVPGAGGFALAAAAGLANTGGLTFFYLAAGAGPFSVVAPIVATAAVIPVAVGVAGGDAATGPKLAGIALALGGVALVSRSPRAVAGDAPPRAVRRAVALSLASAAFTGAFQVLLEPAARRAGTDWTVLTSRAVLLLALLAAGLRLSGAAAALRFRPRSEMAVFALPGLLLFAGTLAYKTATQHGELSVVAVLSSLHPLVTVGLAVALDDERIDTPRAAGIATALVGVILLSAA